MIVFLRMGTGAVTSIEQERVKQAELVTWERQEEEEAMFTTHWTMQPVINILASLHNQHANKVHKHNDKAQFSCETTQHRLTFA